MNFLNKLTHTLTKYIWIAILGLSLIAFFMPNYFRWILNYTSIFLGIAMFGMGTSIEFQDFQKIFARPKEILIGCGAQYAIMPLLAWFFANILNLEPDLALGLILVGSCPGGTASNVITHIAKGNVALSVGMTITSTLIAPLLTPLLVYLLAGQWVEVSFFAMMKTVITIILIPVFLGIGVNHFRKEHQMKSSVLPFISSLAIVFLIAGIVAANAQKIITSGLFVLCLVVLHNTSGLMLGLFLCKLFKINDKDSTAIAIEVGMQNSGLAVSLAAINFAMNPLATLPGALFSVWHNISGSIFAGVRRLKTEA